MKKATQKKTRWLARLTATLLGIIFASVIAGWAATTPVSSEPVAPPTLPAEIQLRPPALKPKLAIPGVMLSSLSSEAAATRLLAESRCLAEVMYYEARGEGEAGEVAVGEVILNRLAGGGHGHTICGVVYEGFDQTFCQFTFVCDGSLGQPKLPEPWRAAQVLAAQLLAGQVHSADRMEGATNYHSASIHASWDSKMVRVAQIGNHVFYRPPALRPSVADTAVRGSLQ
jgi:hypothetical protein